MTKEEMLEKRIITFPSDDNQMTDEGIKRNVYAAMDEYAKQEAIEFLKWAVNEHSVDCEGFSLSGNRFLGGDTKFVNGEELTMSQFYELYLKSKSSPF